MLYSLAACGCISKIFMADISAMLYVIVIGTCNCGSLMMLRKAAGFFILLN